MSITLDRNSSSKRRIGRPSYILSYDEARNALKSKGFNNSHGYLEWVHSEEPEGFSKHPYQLYRYHGTWVSWSHYLGKTDYVKVKAKEDENITTKVKSRSLKSIILQILGLQ